MVDSETENGMGRQGEKEYPAEGLLFFDNAGSLVAWDSAMEQITGLRRTEVLGKKVWDVLPRNPDPREQSCPETIPERISALRGGEPPVQRYEHRIRHPDSGIRQLELFLFPVPDEGRARGGSIVRDITGCKKAAETLAETNRKLTAISSTLRHDINNQLTVLNGYLSLMEGGIPGMETGEIIRILLGASDKIERILQFTREYQEIGLKPPAWLQVGESVRLAGTLVEAGDVRLSPDRSCETIEVFADPLFVQAFFHLIDNSIRHGKTVSGIRVSCSESAGRLQIVYEDDGAGIPDRARPTLFERGKGKNSYGLFLAREIFSVTGITITENGVAGAGARFVITVPPGSFRSAVR